MAGEYKICPKCKGLVSTKSGQKIRRDSRLIGRRVRVINPESQSFGREGKLVGFRGDQDKGNPYVTVFIDGHQVETFSARTLELID